MRLKLLFIAFSFCLGFNGLFAQNNTIFPYIVETQLQKSTTNLMGPKLNIAETWTYKSVLAINALIKEYGEPLENSSGRIVWVLNKPFYKKIIYSEYQSSNFTKNHTSISALNNKGIKPVNGAFKTFKNPAIPLETQIGICENIQQQQIFN